MYYYVVIDNVQEYIYIPLFKNHQLKSEHMTPGAAPTVSTAACFQCNMTKGSSIGALVEVKL